MIDFIKAIISLHPHAVWELNGDNYSNFVWKSQDIQKPTEEELTVEFNRLQAEYDSKEYQRKRAAEYPSFADQFDTIFHEGLDAWKAQIQAVKDKYPKGA
jgi:hypothetical protein